MRKTEYSLVYTRSIQEICFYADTEEMDDSAGDDAGCRAARLTAGCRSDAYYQDRAVQRARAYLLEHATELSAEQLYFVKFNRPVLLVGRFCPAAASRERE